MAEEPSPPAPNPFQLCGVHVDRPSRETCTRCGTFLCEECAPPVGSGRACVACEARSPTRTVPWEDPTVSPLFDGWLRTLVGLLRDPIAFFGGLGDAPPARPPAYFYMLSTALVLGFGLVERLLLGDRLSWIDGARAVGGVALGPIGPIFIGALVASLARSLGAPRAGDPTQRAALYAAAPLALANALVPWVRFVPDPYWIGARVGLLAIASAFATAYLAMYLHGRHRLEWWRAVVATAVPSTLSVVAVIWAVHGSGLRRW